MNDFKYTFVTLIIYVIPCSKVKFPVISTRYNCITMYDMWHKIYKTHLLQKTKNHKDRPITNAVLR